MEHASAVVLHLGLLEVKVLRLVVRDANLKLLWLLTSVLRLVRRPASFGTWNPIQRIREAQGLLTILMHWIGWKIQKRGWRWSKLLADVISEKTLNTSEFSGKRLTTKCGEGYLKYWNSWTVNISSHTWAFWLHMRGDILHRFPPKHCCWDPWVLWKGELLSILSYIFYQMCIQKFIFKHIGWKHLCARFIKANSSSLECGWLVGLISV